VCKDVEIKIFSIILKPRDEMKSTDCFHTGMEARSILMQCGLPHPVLAQVWQLSDVDNDGKLTCDEFCIAMHLIDLARLGRALPAKLPAELMPAAGRTGSFGSVGAMTGAGLGIQSPPQSGNVGFILID
jgi:hypothetical protein